MSEPEHEKAVAIGVLVVNLGTPAAPTTAAVRRFLRQFLSDPRVIEYPRALWWLILNLVILVIRPPRSAAAYRKIWTKRGSPLLMHSRAISDKLQDRLAATVDQTPQVELAMTYGEPSIPSALDKLIRNGARRIVALPLYPQYSATTTAAVFDATTKRLASERWIPELRFINDYHDSPAYIRALAASIQEDWSTNGRAEKLLMSFHGIPRSAIEGGDPYYDQCRQTARLLANELQLNDGEWQLSFQSRVGREEWLQPYTDKTVTALAKTGLARLDVVCPGFATDCLETLEEIAMQNSAIFKAAGGKTLHYIPALNARGDHVDCLAGLVRRHTTAGIRNDDDSPANAARDRADAVSATA